MAENVDLTLLATLVRENLTETRALRRELAMFKSELMGRLAHFETRMENLLHERLRTIE
jgi:hypothetical protein